MIGRDLMARLIANDDWLPTVFAAQNPGSGQQFQIYRDGLDPFSVVSTILWGGAFLKISQPSVWEIQGVLRRGVTRQQPDNFPTERVPAGVSPLLLANTVQTRVSGEGGFGALQHVG